MGQHPITSEDVVNQGKNLQVRKETMRKTNFKLPNNRNMQTEQSTYKNLISDNAEDGRRSQEKVQMLTNLKETSVTIGAKNEKRDYTTEMQQ